jgi:hypothetical protein
MAYHTRRIIRITGEVCCSCGHSITRREPPSELCTGCRRAMCEECHRQHNMMCEDCQTKGVG